MQSVTHKKQQEIWESEHSFPKVLLQMDSQEPSSGVVKFWNWLKGKSNTQLKGLEMGCGKGRNVIWLAQQGVNMAGFDFSPKAITVARQRAKKEGVEKKSQFIVQDATKKWKFQSGSFDIVIDCFATTDIESPKGRDFAVSELKRVVKPGGYVLAYLLSTDEEFHQEIIKKSPADEKNSFLHPTTGKFEKVFEIGEILSLYKNLRLIKKERVPKKTTFFGKVYNCNHHWVVFQK